jgi:fermentation-respiration switch protein FrsA (DUF1100 family)
MDKKRLKKLLFGDFTWKRMISSLIFIYTFFAVYVYFRADSMIFMPQTASYQDTKEVIKLTSGDNIKISAIYWQNPLAKYTILYSHGNAEDLGDSRQVLAKISDLGFNVLAYDYQGYGTSAGKPTEAHAYQDIDSAYNYLIHQLKIPPQRIIIFGRSVGGRPSVDLSSRKPVAGLILESTFTSAFRVVLPVPILPFDKFENLQKIKKVKCPVLVMHGEMDKTIPFSHGEKLFAAAPAPKLSLWVKEADHNDFFWVTGARYGETLQKFAQLVGENQRLSR